MTADARLDVQFRLLRIDTMSTLSAGIKAVIQDLQSRSDSSQGRYNARGCTTKLTSVYTMIRAGGGIYVAPSENGSDRM